MHDVLIFGGLLTTFRFLFTHIYPFFNRYVVKTGVHYGLDYAVYRTLPTHCHSEICAMAVDVTVPLYPRGFRGHFQGNGGLCAENEGEIRDDTCIAVNKRKFEGDEDEKSEIRRDVDGN